MGDITLVFAAADAGSGDVNLFHELLDFLGRRQVRGTFFAVPCGQGQPLDERPEWIEALRRAQEEGHDIGLHGYIHEGFEFGRPPDFMLDLMGREATHYYALTGPYRRGIELYHHFFDDVEAQGAAHYRTVAEVGALPPRPWPVAADEASRSTSGCRS